MDKISKSTQSILKYAIIIFIIISFIMFLASCSKEVPIPSSYDYDDLSKYIKLADYKGMEYEKEQIQVSESEVKEYIDQQLVSSSKSKKITEGEIKKDSVVNVDYTGSLNGVEFDGGSAQGVNINIADNNFIPGFADGMIGHKVGETFDMKVKFPHNYGNNELAGKNTVFKIKVNYIEENTVPVYDEKWIKENSNFETPEEYEKAVKKTIKASKENDSLENIYRYLFDQIMSNSDVIKFPEKELQENKTKIETSYKNYAEQNDIPFDEYLSEQMGMDEKSFKKFVNDTSEKMTKQGLVLRAIARAEKISISKSEYNKFIDKVLKKSGYDRKILEDERGIKVKDFAEQNNIYESLMFENVMNKVFEYSVEKEN